MDQPVNGKLISENLEISIPEELPETITSPVYLSELRKKTLPNFIS